MDQHKTQQEWEGNAQERPRKKYDQAERAGTGAGTASDSDANRAAFVGGPTSITDRPKHPPPRRPRGSGARGEVSPRSRAGSVRACD
ncbi:hypothetical protein ACHAWF_008629 [Thalassiosira exigua]